MARAMAPAADFCRALLLETRPAPVFFVSPPGSWWWSRDCTWFGVQRSRQSDCAERMARQPGVMASSTMTDC